MDLNPRQAGSVIALTLRGRIYESLYCSADAIVEAFEVPS